MSLWGGGIRCEAPHTQTSQKLASHSKQLTVCSLVEGDTSLLVEHVESWRISTQRLIQLRGFTACTGAPRSAHCFADFAIVNARVLIETFAKLWRQNRMERCALTRLHPKGIGTPRLVPWCKGCSDSEESRWQSGISGCCH